MMTEWNEDKKAEGVGERGRVHGCDSIRGVAVGTREQALAAIRNYPEAGSWDGLFDLLLGLWGSQLAVLRCPTKQLELIATDARHAEILASMRNSTAWTRWHCSWPNNGLFSEFYHPSGWRVTAVTQ
jgi:hypothetical protein